MAIGEDQLEPAIREPVALPNETLPRLWMGKGAGEPLNHARVSSAHDLRHGLVGGRDRRHDYVGGAREVEPLGGLSRRTGMHPASTIMMTRGMCVRII